MLRYVLLLFALCAAGTLRAQPQPDAVPVRLYAVIFEITVAESGKVKTLKVNKVIDPASGSQDAIAIHVSNEFVKAVRKHLSQRIYDADPKSFFTYVFYDPERPAKADIVMAPQG